MCRGKRGAIKYYRQNCNQLVGTHEGDEVAGNAKGDGQPQLLPSKDVRLFHNCRKAILLSLFDKCGRALRWRRTSK